MSAAHPPLGPLIQSSVWLQYSISAFSVPFHRRRDDNRTLTSESNSDTNKTAPIAKLCRHSSTVCPNENLNVGHDPYVDPR